MDSKSGCCSGLGDVCLATDACRLPIPICSMLRLRDQMTLLLLISHAATRRDCRTLCMKFDYKPSILMPPACDRLGILFESLP
ncbi:hypothetical protein XALC_2988 [Xanthomonas albilineans GPE PC73]|uniref:Uncharacterized protein n=1 Tax=Xanthomonas albilineans (strain GPE PC73 / CFBP 7063) TaxID=380358 RepID=D2UGF4_XANAP|nr:hypothetical protein XALC_2988 [Xanthomonas albilineans GPE PC73]